jgi:hypothetical protein
MDYAKMQPLKARTLSEAIDEVQRELNVRMRCFPRWIEDGRVSGTDAQDRIDRLQTALEHLQATRKVSAPAGQ